MQNKYSKTWQEKTLIELCEIEIGKTPSRSNKKLWDKTSETSNTWLSIADLNNTICKKVYESKENLSNEGASFVKIVKEGTLLLSFKLTIGRVAFAGKDLRTNEAIAQLPIKDDKELNKYYLYYYLQNYNYDSLLNGDVKVKGKTLNKEKLKQIIIKYPNLSEQERIVGILNKVFENIEQAKKNAEQNLQNAKDLLESELESCFSVKKCNFQQLKNLATISSGFAFKSSSFLNQGKYQVLRLGNVKHGFLKLNSNPVYVNEVDNIVKEKSMLNIGDIVITQTGSKGKRDYGYVVIVNKENLLLNQRLARLQVNENLNTKFLFYYSFTQKFKNDFFKNEGGTVGQGNIGINDINNIMIPNLGREEQQQIVEKLDKFQEQVKSLEAIYEQKIKDLEELKQSILQKAFNGEL